MAFTGVLVTVKGFEIDKGIIVSILAGISYALLGFFSKIATKNHHALVITAWQILISIFLTLPFLFIYDWYLNFNSFTIVLITGILHTAIALFLWYDALNYIELSLSSILQYLDIVFSILLAWIFLDQTPTINQITSSTLIVIAGILSVKKDKNNIIPP